jgi:hypothetical protein
MLFTNKHVVIAMIVAPILAVLAWFAIGAFTGETPRPAVQGESYPLVAKSNCRYPSGACDMENEDFRLRIVYEQGLSGGELVLTSSHPLDGVVLGLADLDEQTAPAVMRASDGQGLEWRMAMITIPAPEQRFRLVAMAGGSSYFADAATTFLQEED